MSITRQVGAKIADYADEIKKFFVDEVHVTVVVRNPKGDDRSMIVTADDTDQVLAFLQRFHPDKEEQA